MKSPVLAVFCFLWDVVGFAPTENPRVSGGLTELSSRSLSNYIIRVPHGK